MKLNNFINHLFKRGEKFDKLLKDQLQFVSDRLVVRAQLNASIDPKIISGELFRSIRAPIKKQNNGYAINLTAGNDVAFYARWLEKGTRDGRLYPRLYLEKSLNHNIETLPKHLVKIAKLAIGRMHGG